MVFSNLHKGTAIGPARLPVLQFASGRLIRSPDQSVVIASSAQSGSVALTLDRGTHSGQGPLVFAAEILLPASNMASGGEQVLCAYLWDELIERCATELL